MAEKKGQSLDIVYEEPPTRPIIPVQGAYGGPSPDGFSVVAHVYAEYATIPAREENVVLEGSRVDPSKATQIKRADATRLVQATLALSPETAMRVGAWLVEQGRIASEHRKANQPNIRRRPDQP
ncbi:MAG: hypothetical protein ACREOC_11645 [Gemmatimonadales bacterium]